MILLPPLPARNTSLLKWWTTSGPNTDTPEGVAPGDHQEEVQPEAGQGDYDDLYEEEDDDVSCLPAFPLDARPHVWWWWW